MQKDAGKLTNTNECQISNPSPSEPKVKTLRDFSNGNSQEVRAREHHGNTVNENSRRNSHGNTSGTPKTSISPEFAKKVLTLIASGWYAKKISRLMHFRYDEVRRVIRLLQDKGAIRPECRSSTIRYVVLNYGHDLLSGTASFTLLCTGGALREDNNASSSRGDSSDGTVRGHNYGLKFRIIKDNPGADFTAERSYEERPQANGAWFLKSFTVQRPVGMTVEITTQSVIIIFHEFEESLDAFLEKLGTTTWRGAHHVFYKMRKKGFKLDEEEYEVIRCHMANERPELNEVVEKGTNISVDLGRKASVLGVKAAFGAKAWIDFSKGNAEIETNDMPYVKNLIAMPERVHRIDSVILPSLARDLQQNVHQVSQLTGLVARLAQETDKYAVNIEKHLKVLDSMDSTMKAIRDSLQSQGTKA